MLKKPASGVLALLRGSTYRSVRLASSLAAALLDGLFEHPAWCILAIPDVQASEIPAYPQSYSAACESKMLKKSASLSCSFGLFGLSGLFGCMRLTRWTRQTGLVPDV